MSAERGVNVDAVERLPHPTRDVLVVRALDGDRTFAGFGKARAPRLCSALASC
jgi:hypothetical protein